MRLTTEDVTSFINSYYAKEFVWGENDCSTFICDYLKKVTGRDHSFLADFSWNNKLQAVKWVIKNKVSVHSALLTQVDHVEIPSLDLAVVGDLIIIDDNGWSTAGIVYHNNRAAFFVETIGVKMLPSYEQNIKRIIRVK